MISLLSMSLAESVTPASEFALKNTFGEYKLENSSGCVINTSVICWHKWATIHLQDKFAPFVSKKLSVGFPVVVYCEFPARKITIQNLLASKKTVIIVTYP